VERLLSAIKLGVVAPGERLPPERELASRLNVSRLTLREAIRSLQEAGWVVSRRGRYGGTFVVHRTDAGDDARRRTPAPAMELADVLAFRSVVEPGAAELAANRALTEAQRERLRNRRDAAARAGLDTYRRADSRLHLAIAELAGSASLLGAVADVRVQVNDLLGAIPLLPPNLAHANDQHALVVDAILAGDGPAARAAMVAHLEGTAALLRGVLS
ncbi:MAG: FadR/GntR family transcriptional regulator, partial [Acidimicrobiales bacterium]